MVKVKTDLTNQIFDRLTVLCQAEDYIKPNGIHEAQWLCECGCSEHNQVIVLGSSLKSGRTKSCGCYGREQTAKSNKALKKKFNTYDLSVHNLSLYQN